MAKVVVIIGSMSDAEKMRPCIDTLERFKVEYEIHCLSAHRAPHILEGLIGYNFADFDQLVLSEERSAADTKVITASDGCGVIIAGAGMAAALPGVIASMTTIPVIGVPLSGSALNGKDALYAIAQMPPGVPVATVAIDGAKNAALLAMQIIAPSTYGLADKLKKYKSELTESAKENDQKIATYYQDHKG